MSLEIAYRAGREKIWATKGATLKVILEWAASMRRLGKLPVSL